MTTLGVATEIASEVPHLADHEALHSTIFWQPTAPITKPAPYRLSTLNEDIFHTVLQGETQGLGAQFPPTNPTALDAYATAITQALHNAMDASMKHAFPHPSGHQWWNEEC